MPGVQKPHCRPCFSQKPCWIGCRSPFFASRSEEHTSELQSQSNLVCRLLLEKKKNFEWLDPALGINRFALRIHKIGFDASNHDPLELLLLLHDVTRDPLVIPKS